MFGKGAFLPGFLLASNARMVAPYTEDGESVVHTTKSHFERRFLNRVSAHRGNALYQGTTLVGPLRPNKNLGFLDGFFAWPGKSRHGAIRVCVELGFTNPSSHADSFSPESSIAF
jgi:hypothetical protein